MNAKHTPGPWACVSTSNHAHDYRLINPDKSPLAHRSEYNDHSEKYANARLIAAAPDLLTALEKIAAVDDGPLEWHINGVYVGRIARAAIAKV